MIAVVSLSPEYLSHNRSRAFRNEYADIALQTFSALYHIARTNTATDFRNANRPSYSYIPIAQFAFQNKGLVVGPRNQTLVALAATVANGLFCS